MSNSVVRPKTGPVREEKFNSADREAMKLYGFIYVDGSYSDEREPRGAYIVPRRPSKRHFWDPDSKEWYLPEDVLPPETGEPGEALGGEVTRVPTVEEVVAANPGVEINVSNSTPRLG